VSVWVNGQPATAIDAADRGLHYGDGCFETIVVADGRLRSLDRHLARLQRGCGTLGIGLPDAALLQCWLQVAADSAPGSGIVKLIVTRGIATGRGYRPRGNEQATVVVSRHPLPPALDSLRVKVSAVRLGHNPLLAGIKHLNRLEQVLAQRQLGADSDEVIMLDQAGNAVCGSMSNLFIVNAGGLVTPRLDRCGVAGIMRSWVIDGARELSIPLVETEVSLAQLLAAPALFMSNVRLSLCSVSELDGQTLPLDPRVALLRRWIDVHAR
jgi:4-amino-4-deoxychorismate lyase